MADTQRPLVVGLGELLWDVFPDSRRPGGAPANVAFHAQQLGCRGMVASRVGRDSLGEEITRYLVDRGLDLFALQSDSEHPTGTVTVDLSDAHHPRYVIHENVAWDFLEANSSLWDAAQQASAICFGTLAQRSAITRETIHSILEASREDCVIVYDVNLRQNWWCRDWVARSMLQANIVKLNEDEVSTLAPVLDCPTAHEAFANAIRDRFHLDAVCVTRGPHGCLVVDASESVDVPGVRVDVVDAVGSGDAFTAALIAARLEKWPLERAARIANDLGALVAVHRGAMPELGAEIAQLRSKHRP